MDAPENKKLRRPKGRGVARFHPSWPELGPLSGAITASSREKLLANGVPFSAPEGFSQKRGNGAFQPGAPLSAATEFCYSSRSTLYILT